MSIIGLLLIVTPVALAIGHRAWLKPLWFGALGLAALLVLMHLDFYPFHRPEKIQLNEAIIFALWIMTFRWLILARLSAAEASRRGVRVSVGLAGHLVLGLANLVIYDSWIEMASSGEAIVPLAAWGLAIAFYGIPAVVLGMTASAAWAQPAANPEPQVAVIFE